MFIVGRINKEIYSCITKNIVTDIVIITDNQLNHILKRHPDAYKDIVNYLEKIISSPDYIIEDKHIYTGLVIKKIKANGKYAQMVLRINTPADKSEYKNSIISCWEISEKRLSNYLKNKRILYKRE